MNLLDDLLKSAVGELPPDPEVTQNEVQPTLDQLIYVESTEQETATKTVETTTNSTPQGEITVTSKITVTNIRSMQKRFSTNISDEKIAAIIATAVEYAEPKIKNCTGDELFEQVMLHTEIARFFQNALFESIRIANNEKLPSKITRREIEELRARRAAEKKLALDKEVTKSKRIKKQIDRAEQGEKMPLWEKYTRSSDTQMRGAGKFLKESAKKGMTEALAVKIWNDLMEPLNPAVLIRNVNGERLDKFMS